MQVAWAVTATSLGPQDTLLACVSKKVPVLLSRGMARLLVIDSVAAPFRCESDTPASAPRARRLQALGAALRQLSATYQSPVLCVNQVGTLPHSMLIPGKTLGEWAAAPTADPGLALPGDRGCGGAGRGAWATRVSRPLGRGLGVAWPQF